MDKPRSSKPRPKHFGTYVTFAVISAFVAFLCFGAFTPGYVPSCDHRSMRPGDACIGEGGGSYDQMVHEHYRDERIGLCVSLPLTFLFTALAVEERRRLRPPTGRRNRRTRKGR